MDKNQAGAEELRRARIEMGIAQDALARIVGVSQATLSRWERGIRKPGTVAHWRAWRRGLEDAVHFRPSPPQKRGEDHENERAN